MKKTGNYLTIFLIISACYLSVSCEDIWNRCVDGNGDRGLETRDIEDFERIEINGDFNVQIDTGSASSVTIETDENLMDLIVTHISGNKLIIETRDGICIRPSHPVEITVSATAMSEITLNGSGLVYSYGFTTDNFSVNLAGSGEIECDDVVSTVADIQLEGSGLIDCSIICDDLHSQVEGSGNIKLRGNCLSAEHKITGSGNIKAGLINSDVCIVYISGSGTADVDVNDALDVTIIGSGKVYYTGDPTVEEYISGSGDVIER